MKKQLFLICSLAIFVNLNMAQTHFQTVYTGNPYLAMNIYITSALLGGVNLADGSEIGAFDGENCVGASLVSNGFDPYLALVAATDDPGTGTIDGFTPGHTIQFRFWDAVNQIECVRVVPTYTVGSGTFSSQGTSMVDLEASDHFVPIYSGNPYLAMNFYITSAAIDDIDLISGDEIGVFDGEYCVGAAVLTGNMDPYLSLVAATDDPGTPEVDGFISGHSISYRMWDASLNLELENVTPTYSVGNGLFASQGTAMADLSGSTIPPGPALVHPIPDLSIEEDVMGLDIADLDTVFFNPSTEESLTYTISNAESNIQLSLAEISILHFELSPDWNGSAEIIIAASNSNSQTVADTFEIAVSPVNDAPVLADISAQEISEDNELSIVLSAEDIDDDDLSYSALSADANVTVLVSNDSLYMTPAANWHGSSVITVTVDDGSASENATDSGSFTLLVTAVNDAPQVFELIYPENEMIINSPDSVALTFNWEASSDVDDDILSYGLTIFDGSSYDSLWTVAEQQFRLNIEELPRNVWLSWEVWVTDNQDTVWSSSSFTFMVDAIVGIRDMKMIPAKYVLEQNYPNPFNPRTTIRYGLADNTAVSLVIYDLRGTAIKTIFSETKAAGWYELTWNCLDNSGQAVSTGLYFTRIQAGAYTKTIKMLYLK